MQGEGSADESEEATECDNAAGLAGPIESAMKPHSAESVDSRAVSSPSQERRLEDPPSTEIGHNSVAADAVEPRIPGGASTGSGFADVASCGAAALEPRGSTADVAKTCSENQVISSLAETGSPKSEASRDGEPDGAEEREEGHRLEADAVEVTAGGDDEAGIDVPQKSAGGADTDNAIPEWIRRVFRVHHSLEQESEKAADLLAGFGHFVIAAPVVTAVVFLQEKLGLPQQQQTKYVCYALAVAAPLLRCFGVPTGVISSLVLRMAKGALTAGRKKKDLD